MTDSLTVKQKLYALRVSIYEGIFANIYANLTGSIFLPAFALALGANNLHIGILASVPFFANIGQLAGGYLVERYNQKKLFAILFSFVSRSLWLPIIITSLVLEKNPGLVLKILIFLVIGSSLFGAKSGVSWLSWMAGLVPDEIRGRYFGLRNSLLGAANVLFSILAGLFLDWFKHHYPDHPHLRAFEIVFLFAVCCGLFSAFLLIRQPEPALVNYKKEKFKELVFAPLRHQQFRKFMSFAVPWSFVVNMASPFFVVYMLNNLHVSYTFAALMMVSSAFADFIGMSIWGHLSDRFGNKPIIILSTIVTTILPLVWLLTSDSKYVVLIFIPLLHLLGGFFWAGYNLCSVNLVFRMVPAFGNSIYFALWNTFNGAAAGLGALTGGIIVKNWHLVGPSLSLPDGSEYKVIFLISGMLRLLSGIALSGLRKVQEPQSADVFKVVRVLSNVRSWASMMGFHPTLHYYLPKHRNGQDSPYWPIWRRKLELAKNTFIVSEFLSIGKKTADFTDDTDFYL